MLRYLLVLTFLFQFFTAQSQEKVTLNGYVRDAGNGEELIGVTVFIPSLKAGTVTNDYGFYAITVPKGTYDIQYSFVGYKIENVKLELNGNTSRNIELSTEAEQMDEVVIEAKPLDENVASVQMSKNTVNMTQVKKLPALFGEVDIIKNIQMMPGVITAGEGTSAFFVRGGSGDQNLILIDEAPVYDPSHLFGLFSVFNADVIKDSEIYRGGIPARYGGRLSSIVDVRTKDGNNKCYEVNGGIGTLASRVAIEGPIVKDKSSFIVSGRRSYADLFLRAAGEDNIVYFYDINAKVNLKYNNNNRFFLSFYNGRDVFKFGGDFGFNWGNMTGTFRWNHLFNDRLFMNTSLIASNFDYKLGLDDAISGFEWTSNLQELSLKNDLSYALNTKNELSFGYHLTGRSFSPGHIQPTSGSSFFSELKLEKMYALDHGIYVSNQQKVSDKFMLDYGLRLSVFQNVGTADVYLYRDPKDNVQQDRTDTLHYDAWQTIKTYVNLEPRLGIRYALDEKQSIKVSYNRMVQNTHLLASGTVPVPFNTWNPSSYYLKPQLADQIAGGYFRNFNNNMYEFSIEGYYKDFKNVTDFADNAQLFFNDDLSTEFRQGDSWSYGAELMLNKKQGKLIGMATYTWSKTMREIPGVNQGKEFPANHDRRNVVNIQASYDLNEKWTFGAAFTYSTGRPITLPEGKYEFGTYNPDHITDRNRYRLPDFHRLDLSVTLNPRKNLSRKWKGQWVFSVYNAYNRQNPFTVYTRTKEDDDGNVVGDGTEKEARLIYLFPILPSVTYNIKFNCF
ncbi:TonB-dependent receptor [Chryseosolibacter indicus]|uniref:TonB-dependent receptor n=1 Tax=Chryseosolibacter indicus TaxID=2782351 RepID=A0ABS5VTU1_9BACT|nr:TonB-dependent receptor [Chryseosolibacter indicus]MBT1704847.1 TonB-dependent receptor [Chryseosolibacter indicus]